MPFRYVANRTCVDKRNQPPGYVIPSGVEESTTLEDGPTQDKTSYSGRFLDSHSLPRNDMSGGWFHSTTGVVFGASPERHIGRSLRFRWKVLPFNRAGLYSKRCLAMNHRRYIAWYHSTAGVLFGTLPERHTGRSLRFRWKVCFFNRPGLKVCVFDLCGQTGPRPETQNCQLSIVHCQFK